MVERHELSGSFPFKSARTPEKYGDMIFKKCARHFTKQKEDTACQKGL